MGLNVCGEVPDRPPVVLSPAAGGLLCADHRGEDPASRPCSGAERSELRRLAATELGEPLVPGDPADALRVRRHVMRFSEYHLEQRLRTTPFLDSLLDDGDPSPRR